MLSTFERFFHLDATKTKGGKGTLKRGERNFGEFRRKRYIKIAVIWLT
jgi:hypothetical protein